MANFDWEKCFGCQQTRNSETPYCTKCKSVANSFWESAIKLLGDYDGDIHTVYGTEIIITASSRAKCLELYAQLLKKVNVEIDKEFRLAFVDRDYIMKIKKDTNLHIRENSNDCILSDRVVLRTCDRM
ncbi:hypothetical protein F-M6_0163 [Faustovirus]|nr:hypothetical protein F-M6_0163 [Faustovirus]